MFSSGLRKAIWLNVLYQNIKYLVKMLKNQTQSVSTNNITFLNRIYIPKPQNTLDIQTAQNFIMVVLLTNTDHTSTLQIILKFKGDQSQRIGFGVSIVINMGQSPRNFTASNIFFCFDYNKFFVDDEDDGSLSKTDKYQIYIKPYIEASLPITNTMCKEKRRHDHFIHNTIRTILFLNTFMKF